MNTPSLVLTLAQNSTTSTTAAPGGIVGGLIGLVIGSLVGGLVCGLVLMLVSGPIGKVKVGFGPAFKTMFIVALIAGVIGLLLSFVIGVFSGIVQLAAFFGLAMVFMNKNHNIEMGRAALIALIQLAVFIAIAFVIGLILAAVLVAAGMTGAAANP